MQSFMQILQTDRGDGRMNDEEEDLQELYREAIRKWGREA